MKLLIWLEVVRLVFLVVVVKGVEVGNYSLWYFLSCLIFLICESRLGFLLYVTYIRMDYEVVKKIGLIQCQRLFYLGLIGSDPVLYRL